MAHENIGRAINLSKETARLGIRLPLESGKFAVAAAAQIAETVDTHLLPHNDQLAEQIITHAPLMQARQGAHDIERGFANNDEQLLQWGERSMVAALIKADRRTEVPDEVTAEIAQLTLRQRVDPFSTPEIDEQVLKTATKIRQTFLPASYTYDA